MIRHYFKVAFRNHTRHKAQSIISLFSLAKPLHAYPWQAFGVITNKPMIPFCIIMIGYTG